MVQYSTVLVQQYSISTGTVLVQYNNDYNVLVQYFNSTGTSTVQYLYSTVLAQYQYSSP